MSSFVSGSMLTRVLVHEIGHAIMFSYGLIDELHAMVKPEYWIKAEEWVCNFLADYGMAALNKARKIIGKQALVCVPEIMQSLIA